MLYYANNLRGPLSESSENLELSRNREAEKTPPSRVLTAV